MHRLVPLILPLALMTAACATVDDTGYPSLERRAAELRAMPASPTQPQPTPPSPVTAEFRQALAGLAADAERGDSAFRSALPVAERAIAAARGAPVASESWFAAQAALSSLEQTRAPTLLALGEIDRLLVAARLSDAAERGDALAALAERVAAQESAQTATLARLAAMLGG